MSKGNKHILKKKKLKKLKREIKAIIPLLILNAVIKTAINHLDSIFYEPPLEKWIPDL